MNLASSSKIRLVDIFFTCVTVSLKIVDCMLKNRSSFEVIKSPIVSR